MPIAYIALGSNLNDRAAHLLHARTALDALPGTKVTAASSVYETDPVGPQDQPRFLNAVLQLQTTLQSRQLLDHLLDIEKQNGRERRDKWGPRTLDLDLLLYDDKIIDSPGLAVPHPHLSQRAFVLKPLADIAPDLVHPVTGRTMAELLTAAPPLNMQPIEISGWSVNS